MSFTKYDDNGHQQRLFAHQTVEKVRGNISGKAKTNTVGLEPAVFPTMIGLVGFILNNSKKINGLIITVICSTPLN